MLFVDYSCAETMHVNYATRMCGLCDAPECVGIGWRSSGVPWKLWCAGYHVAQSFTSRRMHLAWCWVPKSCPSWSSEICRQDHGNMQGCFPLWCCFSRRYCISHKWLQVWKSYTGWWLPQSCCAGNESPCSGDWEENDASGVCLHVVGLHPRGKSQWLNLILLDSHMHSDLMFLQSEKLSLLFCCEPNLIHVGGLL